MNILRAELQKDFYVRHGCVGALFVFFGGTFVVIGLQRFEWMIIAGGLGFISIWAALIWWSLSESIRELNLVGAVRRDGRQLPWSEFEQEVEGYYFSKTGGQVLNHIDLKFRSGRVRLYPLTLKNYTELMRYARERAAAARPAGSAAAPPPKAAPRVQLVAPEPVRKPVSACSICSQLLDHQTAMQKIGRESEDTHLPAAAGKLTNLGDLQPGQTRGPELDQCPECGRYYWYKVDYDYLATGSEDSQTLIRLSDSEGAALHDQLRAGQSDGA
ncbi:hypothetical protein C7S18_22455 [Ahniella affigens]|uniref:Uncharacterized protein n=1 Tax=Ahniella affigens TaxID=2021234 RepID=A0A2P1PY44_9GAMM|nr:hypothetical protein [Ahniella affigens]AVP99765.1 hypothetical protein C7S18_22455 [Ahniella affigens]